MSPSHKRTYKVNILGAGVSGLSTALALLEKKNYSVKIYATHLPSDLSIDYTSPWAGAHWRSYADIADVAQQELDTATFNRLVHLADTDPKAGIMYLSGHDFWDVKPKNFEDPWFKRLVKNYRHLKQEELPPGVEFGITYTTGTVNKLHVSANAYFTYVFIHLSIHAPKYLKYLQEQILARGGSIDRATIPSLKALARAPHSADGSKADIIINCSGLGSRNLPGVHDHQMFPTRGQIVIVKVPDSLWPKAKQFTMERYAEGSAMGTGTITYVIPRDNGEIVLGGTMEHWNYQEAASEETTKAIVKRVVATKPDLFSNATILRSCVGLRPNRRGGVRISAAVEQLDWNEGWGDSKVVVVAHNYGHAGFGYQASVGCAAKVVEQVEGCLNELDLVRASSRSMSKL
ncbi:hypothetical protein EC957_011246 [Mortierella hygrophila]|uniref:FAD dependent oxidoreductase domain-containing protein n=1 Tax=Mortierella hygrophila TaxID=979708 RepID=A0A9P6F8Z3_9FUNG|nr:hypothetical protein EC957_011246 [Mortierella hygrophila]